MTLNKTLEREAILLDVVRKVTEQLKPKSLAIMYRKPLLDEEYPETSDIDITAIWTQREELPERLIVETSTGKVYLDVLWVPVSKMLNAQEAASYKTLPHLLLESEITYTQSNTIQLIIEDIKQKTYDNNIWKKRLKHQLEFGDATFEESQKNLDFPPAALFFLQTTHANYIVALADCLKQSTMSLLTRPVKKFKQMAIGMQANFVESLEANLNLNADPTPSLAALRRIYDAVAAKCSGKQPYGVSNRTLGHYTYTLSPIEINYRLAFAKSLIQNEDIANANFYLRFWAYSLARCPAVLHEASQFKRPSFYVPTESLKTYIDATIPEILNDVKTVMGGEIVEQKIQESIQGTIAFRDQIIDRIRGSGIEL